MSYEFRLIILKKGVSYSLLKNITKLRLKFGTFSNFSESNCTQPFFQNIRIVQEWNKRPQQ